MSDTFYGESYRESVRRQFRVSVALVVLMAIGAFAAGFVRPINVPQNVQNFEDNGVFIGRLVTTVDQ